MVWERFHHICRRSLAPLRPGEPVAARIKAIEADPDTAFYGARLKPGTLPRRILDRISEDPNQERALRLLQFYASLDLAAEPVEPLRLRRIARYLVWMAVLSAALFGIYQFLMQSPFRPLSEEALQATTSSLVALLSEYSAVVALVAAVLLGVGLVLGRVLRGLADWPSGRGRGGLICLLAFPRASALYADLEAAVLFPLGPEAVDGKSKVAAHLWKLEEEGVDIRDEITALVRSRQRALVEVCEKQICVLYTVCVLVVAATIALFLLGVFPPIFRLA
ncbi:hypothetical protein [Vreelandella utahensis]|uniref:hypothetical protein n=1 Tax=Vreelandella halophila TaxID=86177 RepID=UPI0009878D8D|nr:hypothetical protein [Halomonas utahensis]